MHIDTNITHVTKSGSNIFLELGFDDTEALLLNTQSQKNINDAKRTNKETCPICDEGYLEQLIDKNPVEYKGHTTGINSYYSICDACGCEQASAAQMRDNKIAMLALKKRIRTTKEGET